MKTFKVQYNFESIKIPIKTRINTIKEAEKIAINLAYKLWGSRADYVFTDFRYDLIEEDYLEVLRLGDKNGDRKSYITVSKSTTFNDLKNIS